ncbi:MAG: hypothetical protein Tsb0020_42060 [Haliangiales bacterium]
MAARQVKAIATVRIATAYQRAGRARDVCDRRSLSSSRTTGKYYSAKSAIDERSAQRNPVIHQALYRAATP